MAAAQAEEWDSLFLRDAPRHYFTRIDRLANKERLGSIPGKPIFDVEPLANLAHDEPESMPLLVPSSVPKRISRHWQFIALIASNANCPGLNAISAWVFLVVFTMPLEDNGEPDVNKDGLRFAHEDFVTLGEWLFIYLNITHAFL